MSDFDKVVEKMSVGELRDALMKAIITVDLLMQSHEELLAGVGNIVCDIGLLNECRNAGDGFLRQYK